MEVFDCHFHVEKGVKDYPNLPGRGNVIFNEVSSWQANAPKFSSYEHSLIFDYKGNFQLVADAVASRKIRALKIHSRAQQISKEDYPDLSESLKKTGSDIPIIYDAFYFGHEVKYQPSLTRLIELAQTFPRTKFIVAHAGGHHILDYFFHLRDLRNIGFDLSFSIQYLEGTSAWLDLVKLIRYTDHRKLFWGSDFPFANPALQQDSLLKILNDLKFTSEQTEAVFFKNWMEFTEY